MKEVQGDIFDAKRDWLVFTANSTIRNNGSLVMGAGIARAVRDRFPGCDRCFGELLGMQSFQVFYLMLNLKYRLIALQTKINWQDPSPLHLVLASCRYLGEYAIKHPNEQIVTVRPGCSLGGLEWETVRAMIKPIWPDNITVYSKVQRPSVTMAQMNYIHHLLHENNLNLKNACGLAKLSEVVEERHLLSFSQASQLISFLKENLASSQNIPPPEPMDDLPF